MSEDLENGRMHDDHLSANLDEDAPTLRWGDAVDDAPTLLRGEPFDDAPTLLRVGLADDAPTLRTEDFLARTAVDPLPSTSPGEHFHRSLTATSNREDDPMGLPPFDDAPTLLWVDVLARRVRPSPAVAWALLALLAVLVVVLVVALVKAHG